MTILLEYNTYIHRKAEVLIGEQNIWRFAQTLVWLGCDSENK